MQNITILGSTGSIGQNTLNVVSLHPEKFTVYALTANKNVDMLFEQCVQFRPKYAVIRDNLLAEDLHVKLRLHEVETEVLSGDEGLNKVASMSEVTTVMACIVGSAGLASTLAAAHAGKRILLANKEALVMSGDLLIQAVRESGAVLLPVDSEHNAIFQCLPPDTKLGHQCKSVKRIVLTASGGAFRDWPLEKLKNATPIQACTHPNWAMGAKITVDSATMMNKALEVIEASYLFGLSAENIEVVLHPQSVIHSLVEYYDGSMLAQLGEPDMRIPISYVLDWPNRIESGAKNLNLLEIGRLDFKKLSRIHYPCLDFAYEVLKKGGTAPAILNAANEVAVQTFLDEKIRFTDISKLIAYVLSRTTIQSADSLENILAADQQAREIATNWASNQLSSFRAEA